MTKLKIYAAATSRTLMDADDDGNSTTPPLEPPEFEIIVTFLVISSIIASLLEGYLPRKLLRVLPQPVILMLIYVVVGVIAGTPFAVEIDAEMILTIFLPALLTNEALKINTTPFYKSLLGLMWLIGPALFLGAAIVAVYPYAFFPENDRFNWNVAMAFGGMLATTDPIAVVCFDNLMVANERKTNPCLDDVSCGGDDSTSVVSCHKRSRHDGARTNYAYDRSAMVSGESLLNDATSIICVTLFLGLNSGKAYTAGELIFFIVNQLIFSVLWGIGVGMVTFIILRSMKVLDAHTLFALTIATPYLVFTVATYYFHDSGVLSLIPVGLFFNHFISGVAGEEQVHAIQEFWETLSFLATSWLYSLTGLLVGIELVSHDVTAIDWGSLFGLYLWVILARFVVVFISLPVFMYAPGGYGFNVREAILLAWGGLRGAVGLLLALIIKGNPSVTPHSGRLVLFMMAGIVVLIQIQGITFPLLLKYLDVIIKPNARVHDTMRTKMSYRAFFVLTRAGVEPDQARGMLRVHKEDKERPAGEVVVTRFSTRRRQTLMETDPDMMLHPLTNEYVSKSVLGDKRRRLLQAQRATYNNLISRELISRTAWLILSRGLDIQLDKDDISMNQWGFLLQHTPKACYNAIGIHTTDEKALLKALYAGELESYLRFKAELRERQLMMSQRSRGRSRLGGIVRKVSFDKEGEEAKPKTLYEKLCCISSNPTDEEVLADIHKRDFGLDLEDALTFGYVCWAFLIAQSHSEELLSEMFKLDEEFIAFDTEQQALKAEIEQSRRQPALFLDILLEHFPTIARKIKSSQAVAEIKDQVYGYVHELYSNGLIEIHAMKKLVRDGDKIVRVVKHLDFPLEAPFSVGPNGVDVLRCPNFHPFFQSDILKKVSLDEFKAEDMAALFQEALDEKTQPITEGFWARRAKTNDESVSPEKSLKPGDETQLAFSDASVSNGEIRAKEGSSGSIAPEDRPIAGGFGVAAPLESFRHVKFAVEGEEGPSPITPTAAWTGAVKIDHSSSIEGGSQLWQTVSPTAAKTPTTEAPVSSAATAPRTSRLGREGSIKLIRQISGGNPNTSGVGSNEETSGTASGLEEIAPLAANEYHQLLASRPTRLFRQTSFHQKKL